MDDATYLEFLWREVRHHPERIDELVQQVHYALQGVSDEQARALLTADHSPADRAELDRLALDNLHRRHARVVAGAGRGQVVMHLDGDPRNNDLDNLRVVDPRDVATLSVPPARTAP